SSLNTIVGDAFRGNEMLKNIGALFAAGDQDMQPLSMNDVVQDGLNVLRGELEARAVSVQARLAPELPWIVGDKEQLPQVLIDLLNNAMEAMAAIPARRVVRVSTAHKCGGKIMLVVEDSGPGLPPEMASTVFEPLVTTKASGTGLGLALCQM